MDVPFYAEGLGFSCRRCSSCCTGEPGYVFLSKHDLQVLLKGLSLDFASFRLKYCKLVNMGDYFALSLREKSDFSCTFWEESKCSIYEIRPIQCSTYPFWSSIVASPKAWEDESRSCPGINSGETRSREEIELALFTKRAAGLLALSCDQAKRPENIDEDQILGG